MRPAEKPFGRVEALTNRCVIATYEARMPDRGSLLRRAAAFAVGQSIGTWIAVPGITPEMIDRYQGQVVGLYETGCAEDGTVRCLLRVAFPTENFGGSLTQMMTALVGNDVSTALRTKLIDLELVNGAEEEFSSPRQDLSCLRALTGAENRPLVLNMIKPCAGYTPEEGAKLFRQVALGGIDLVKDDELLGSPCYNDVAERTRLYSRVSDEVYAQTGKRTLYVPNISGKPSQMRDNVRAVLDAGAKACLVNFVFGGLDTLAELNEEFGDKIFLLAHYAGLSVMESGVGNGVFLGILARLAGAHGVMTPAPNPKDAAAMLTFHQTVQMQRLPIGRLAPTVTAVGGGITPANQAWIGSTLGNDVIIGIGGAIQGHPSGATAGAKAAMCAVAATAAAIELETAATDCPELREALNL